MSGRTGIAPCGHTGECIIGTYYRCSLGCDSKTAQATPVAVRRGEVGHVDACACPRCQIRRACTTIVVRSRDGNDIVRVAWDGVSKRVDFIAAADGDARGYKMLDAHGKEIGSGALDAAIKTGWRCSLDIELLIDGSVQMKVGPACEQCGAPCYASRIGSTLFGNCFIMEPCKAPAKGTSERMEWDKKHPPSTNWYQQAVAGWSTKPKTTSTP